MELNQQGPQRQRRPYTTVSALVHAPIQVSATLLYKGVRLLQPLAPVLVPILVFLCLVPLLLFFSLSAGFFVWKGVAVGWESVIYLQYGDGVPPYAELSLPDLAAQQRYDISLLLSIPAIEANYAIGNFMTTLTLLTPANQTLVSVRRPAIVPPPTLGFLPFLPSRPSVLQLEIPLLDSYAARTSNAIARVELGRRDSWKSVGNGEGRELSVLSASLRGVVKHHGVRGLLTRFPVTSSLVSAGIFLAVSLLILAACIIPTVRLPPKKETPGVAVPAAPNGPKSKTLSPPPSYMSDHSSDGDDKPPKRRRRARARGSGSRRQSVASSSGIKSEEGASILPQGESSNSSPLRRRRSRLSDSNS